MPHQAFDLLGRGQRRAALHVPDDFLRECAARVGGERQRPSIPPERLLKGQLLIALHSVRSDGLFCQMLDYNILFRWFLDMSLEDPGLDQSHPRLRMAGAERILAAPSAPTIRMLPRAIRKRSRRAAAGSSVGALYGYLSR